MGATKLKREIISGGVSHYPPTMQHIRHPHQASRRLTGAVRSDNSKIPKCRFTCTHHSKVYR
ncbi:hypothetical protein E2C01_099418 [Portunus trituberculatus]|uniref:Uncharacterized protein n=1 Tax=Portunus trituberculatus TaxID=210409 RepID=A0A5B7KGT3_PORTR|nr:hypothetical protein [Portunus trituberculatus]